MVSCACSTFVKPNVRRIFIVTSHLTHIRPIKLHVHTLGNEIVICMIQTLNTKELKRPATYSERDQLKIDPGHRTYLHILLSQKVYINVGGKCSYFFALLHGLYVDFVVHTMDIELNRENCQGICNTVCRRVERTQGWPKYYVIWLYSDVLPGHSEGLVLQTNHKDCGHVLSVIDDSHYYLPIPGHVALVLVVVIRPRPTTVGVTREQQGAN